MNAVDELLLFIGSRLAYGLMVFSEEYGLLSLESVSRDGMVELKGISGESIYLPFFKVKPVLYPTNHFILLNPPVVNNEGNVIYYEMDSGPAQFSDILSLIQKGKAVSVYDLPYNPYVNYANKQSL